MEVESDRRSNGSPQEPPVDSAVLAEQVKSLAREGKFKEAEQLREKLLENDPMALAHIVSTAEVIEEEKTRYLDKDHLAIWDQLYNDLSSEETNLLFFSMEKAQVAPNKLLLSQGKKNSRLFLIDSGKVAVFFRKGDKNVPLGQLGRGDVLGEENFFGISLCTISAVTQSKVALRHLGRQDAEAWRDKLPGLYEKLAVYCQKYGKSRDLAARKNLEKRTYERYGASAAATAYLVNAQGEKTETYFRGPVTDISRSGICLSIKCSKQETARTLLGKNVEVSVAFEELDDKVFKTFGAIVKVTYHLHNDYDMHVRFSSIISEEVFEKFPCGNSSKG